MMTPDQRERTQRIVRLRLAADVITLLKRERPELIDLYVSKTIVKQLLMLADQYEAKPLGPNEVPPLRAKRDKKVVHVLEFGERKPPQRVSMAHRRKPIPTQPIAKAEDPLGMTKALKNIQRSGRHPFPIMQREHDDEAAHEEGQAYGGDVPDGSD